MKKDLKEIADNFFVKYILNKILFAKNFVKNTYKFYNFVENNIYERIICQLKFLERITEKKSFFLQFFLINLQENYHVIWEFLVVYHFLQDNIIYVLLCHSKLIKNKIFFYLKSLTLLPNSEDHLLNSYFI